MDTRPVFRPSFGNRPDQLVGRETLLQTVVDGIQSFPGSAERATLLIGQRGMGKTAMLLEIADRAEQLDFITARITCGEMMLDNLIEILQKSGSRYIRDSKSPIKGFSEGALGFSIGLTFTEEAQRSFGFRVKLEMICEKLAEAGKRVLLLVDEVDPGIVQMRELAAVYQELVGNEKDIAIVMAGLPTSISDILNYKTLTFLNRAQRIPMGLIPVSEVELYYSTAFPRAGITSSSAMVRESAQATYGFPYMVQLIGYFLSKLSADGEPVNEERLSQAVRLSTNEIDNKIFQAMLNPLSDTDLVVLRTIAGLQSPCRMVDLEKEMKISHGKAQTYRRRLLDAGVIISQRRGEIELIMPQLREYLRRSENEDGPLP